MQARVALPEPGRLDKHPAAPANTACMPIRAGVLAKGCKHSSQACQEAAQLSSHRPKPVRQWLQTSPGALASHGCRPLSWASQKGDASTWTCTRRSDPVQDAHLAAKGKLQDAAADPGRLGVIVAHPHQSRAAVLQHLHFFVPFFSFLFFWVLSARAGWQASSLTAWLCTQGTADTLCEHMRPDWHTVPTGHPKARTSSHTGHHLLPAGLHHGRSLALGVVWSSPAAQQSCHGTNLSFFSTSPSQSYLLSLAPGLCVKCAGRLVQKQHSGLQSAADGQDHPLGLSSLQKLALWTAARAAGGWLAVEVSPPCKSCS